MRKLKNLRQKYKNILLKDNNLKRLLIYQSILNSKKNFSKCKELNELIECGLVYQEFTGEYKIGKPIFATSGWFDKGWIKRNILFLRFKNRCHLIVNNSYCKSVAFIVIIMLLALGVYGYTIHNSFKNAESKAQKLLEKLEKGESKYSDDQALLLGVESASKLVEGLSLKQILKFGKHNNNIQDYPTVKPILALRNALNNIHIRQIDEYDPGIREVKFNSDGTQIAVGVEKEKGKETIYIYDKKKFLLLKENTSKTVSNLAFNPSNSFIAVAIKNRRQTIKIYKILSDKLKEQEIVIDSYPREISKINFSQDGKYFFALDRKNRLKLWKCSIQDEKLKLLSIDLPNELSSEVKSVSFSPQTDILAVATVQNIYAYDLSTKKILFNNNNDNNIKKLTSISFSQDGKYLATTEDNQLCIRDWNRDLNLSNYRCLNYNADESEHNPINKIDDVKFASGNLFGEYSFTTTNKEKDTIVLWTFLNDQLTNKNLYKILEIKQPKINTFSLNFSQDGAYIVTGQKQDIDQNKRNKITLWDLSDLKLRDENRNIIPLGKESDIKIKSIRVSRVEDNLGRLIILKQDDTYEVVDLESTFGQTDIYQGKYKLPTRIQNLVFLPNKNSKHDDQLAIVSNDRHFLLCDSLLKCENNIQKNDSILFEKIKKIKTIKSNSTNNRIVMIDESNNGYFINLSNLKSKLIPDLQEADISSDGNYIAILKNKQNEAKILKWNNSDNSLRTIKDLGTGVKKMQFSPKGNYLGVHKSDGLELRTAKTEFKEYNSNTKERSKSVESFSFSLDEKYLTFIESTNSNLVKIKKLSDHSFDLIDNFLNWFECKNEENLDTNISLIFSPNRIDDNGIILRANLFATVEKNETIRLWHIRNKEARQIGKFHADAGKIIDHGITFSLDGKYLIALEKNNNDEIIMQNWNLDEELDLTSLIDKGEQKLKLRFPNSK